MANIRYRSADLVELFPDNDGKRYEIIDGELFVAKQPSLEHQIICTAISSALHVWSIETGMGVAAIAPGIIFADDDDVAPDVVWVSHERRRTVVQADRKLHAAPELVVEVLSPGPVNLRRDRDVKLGLYSRRAVREYWIVDHENRQIEVYRRENAALVLANTLLVDETLESPLLPGFSLSLRDLFGLLPLD